MMNDAGIIAKRYSEALFNLSLREKNLAEVEKAFDSFVNETTKNTKFVNFMESPVIPHKNKEELLAKIIPEGMPPLLVLFLKLILSKKRFEILTTIESSFQQRSERYRGIHKAELVTAVSVEAATEKKLISLLEKGSLLSDFSNQPATPQQIKVKLVTKTDKNLIGGFILKLDERVVDASYRTKLREMRQKLSAVHV